MNVLQASALGRSHRKRFENTALVGGALVLLAIGGGSWPFALSI